MKTLKLLSALTLAALITGCAGGAASEKDTPIADIQAKAVAADQPELEATIEDYRATIADLQAQAEAKLAEAAAAAKQAAKDMSIDDLMEQGGDKARDLAAEYEDEAEALAEDIQALQERLAVYAAELQQRVQGG